eukprot:tig00001496_g9204.t1
MAGVVGPCPPGVTELAQVDVSPVDWIAAHGVDTLEINQQACRLSLQLAGIQAQLDGVSALANGSLTRAVAEDNHAWMLTNGFLVFFLQLGFAALTAGCVRAKNLKNVLMKNVIDACFGAIAWWLVGFGIAYGDGVNGNGFLGTKDYVLSNVPGTYYGGGDRHAFWFFQWAFSATAATIVSGAVAERIKFEAYLIFTFLCSGWIYPVIAHWGWSDSGWLSAFRATVQPDGSTRFDPLGGSGLFDFAGGGIVHMVGGFAAIAAAYVLGPRVGRFDSRTGKPLPMPQYSYMWATAGTLIIWFGFYGFNCGSTLAVHLGDRATVTAGRVAINTTLSAAAGAMMGLVISKVFLKIYDGGLMNNCLLAGLVASTSGCALMEPWAAVITGAVAAWFYYGASNLALKLKIDDPLDAFAVHGGGGMWALISVAFFAKGSHIQDVYGIDYAPKHGVIYGGSSMIGLQFLGLVVIAAWAFGHSFAIFSVLKMTIGIRVPAWQEQEGMDFSKHGGYSEQHMEALEKGMYGQGAYVTDSREESVHGPKSSALQAAMANGQGSTVVKL